YTDCEIKTSAFSRNNSRSRITRCASGEVSPIANIVDTAFYGQPASTPAYRNIHQTISWYDAVHGRLIAYPRIGSVCKLIAHMAELEGKTQVFPGGLNTGFPVDLWCVLYFFTYNVLRLTLGIPGFRKGEIGIDRCIPCRLLFLYQ